MGCMAENTLRRISAIANQDILQKQLHVIFPKEKIKSEVRKATNVKHSITGSYLEVDLFIPRHNIAFEFQDIYHYATTWYSNVSKQNIQSKDKLKKDAICYKGMSLVEVPCWWDGCIDSLLATIFYVRPDLIEEITVNPIPFNPPFQLFQNIELPNVGEPMLASFPTDIHVFSKSLSCNSWWMGEKYDGTRCCWNENLVASGNRVELSPSIAAHLPAICMDAEFWFGRGCFVDAQKVVKGAIHEVNWHSLRIISFDSMAYEHQSQPVEKRYKYLLEEISNINPLCIISARMICQNTIHLKRVVQNVAGGGGEGVILQRLASNYEQGRSASLIKLKATQEDMEGIVTGIGKCKSVLLKLPNEQTLIVPPHAVLVAPKIGNVVSFSYVRHAKGSKPIGPTIYRIRTDVSWPEVVQNFIRETVYLNTSSRVLGSPAEPLNFWTKQKMRKFLEDFATNRGMDPLLAETWYNTSSKDICQSKGGTTILKKMQGYFRALRQLFPEVKFDNAAFHQHSWNDVNNRRKLFETYARGVGFDPLCAEKWYLQSNKSILSTKGAFSVLSYHNHSISSALLDLFPDIGLQRTKFYTIWDEASLRRKFFEDYASQNGFDPLHLENWTLQHREAIAVLQESTRILLHHNSSVSQALSDLFPEIGHDKEKLQRQLFHWQDEGNRRLFFENYASDIFDHQNPEHWYLQPQSNITLAKDARKVLYYHNQSVGEALNDLFPNMKLDKRKFDEISSQLDVRKLNEISDSHQIQLKAKVIQDPYEVMENRRSFFDDYAKERGFDALKPEVWYSQSKDNIMLKKGASRVLGHYSHNLSKALVDVYPTIGLKKSKLTIQFWCNRRRFFEGYAEQRGFDPLSPQNWYLQSKRDILATKGSASVLPFYDNDLSAALSDLFPDIGIDKEKFRENKISQKLQNRRKSFEDFAIHHNFDPKNPWNWYNQPRHKITAWFVATKGVSVLQHYHFNVSHALLDLFPTIGLDKAKLLTSL